jgi:hypothetical protein
VRGGRRTVCRTVRRERLFPVSGIRTCIRARAEPQRTRERSCESAVSRRSPSPPLADSPVTATVLDRDTRHPPWGGGGGEPARERPRIAPHPIQRFGAHAWVGQIVTFFAYRPPSRPLGSLTPTQPGRVTNPTQGHPGPPWEAPQAECRSLRREPKPPA